MASASMAAASEETVPAGVDVEQHLRELYREFAGPLVVRLTRMCGDHELAADLAQDAFVVALRSPKSNDVENKAGWLYQIAYNLLRDHRRTHARRRGLWSRLRGAKTPGVGEGPELCTTPAGSLEHALRTLDHKYRDAFVLRVVEALSLEEAAELLGIKPKAVSYRSKRAEAIVREFLANQGVHP